MEEFTVYLMSVNQVLKNLLACENKPVMRYIGALLDCAALCASGCMVGLMPWDGPVRTMRGMPSETEVLPQIRHVF